MKRVSAILLCLALLSGCSANESIDHALALRNKIVSASSCSFECIITADYSDRIYTFGMNCTFDSSGNMEFSILEPETISGICGSVDGQGGKITFDDQALFFELIADGYLSPVSAPWIFMKLLRSGYLDSCGEYEDGYYITIDDSYEKKPLMMEVWTDQDNCPCRAELLWEGRKVLSLDVVNFSCL